MRSPVFGPRLVLRKAGWEPIPHGRKGGQRRRLPDGSYEYRYDEPKPSSSGAPDLELLLQAAIAQHGEARVKAALATATKGAAAAIDNKLQDRAREVAKRPEVAAIGAQAVKALGLGPGNRPKPETIRKITHAVARNDKLQGIAREELRSMQGELGDIVVAEAVKATGEKKPSRIKAIFRAVLRGGLGPFAFGFIDNVVLYLAGASIDKGLAVAGFSAAAVAGLGNAVSDSVGQAVGSKIDAAFDKVGLKDEGGISEETKKKIQHWSGIAGIFAGCVAGMVPLLFGVRFGKGRLVIDLEKARRVDPNQLGLFGEAPAKPKPKKAKRKPNRPPGSGWQIIPGGRKGGFRRRKGKGWEYWYPDTGVVSKPKRAPKKAKKKAKKKVGPELVIGPQTERGDAVTEAMAKKKTKGKRKEANETALEIVAKAAKAGRGLTDAEASKVAEYTGRGGISEDLNQFYTRTDVSEAMWDIMSAYQDDLERVLEPSCGAGVLIQTAPKGTKVTGIELHPESALVAEALHGHKHEIESKSFELFSIERSGEKQNFDAVIANPPYCTRTGDIPRHKPEFKSADQYFIDTSLDHVKDGGLCVFLIHPGVLNNKNPGAQEFRKRLMARSEIVDAFRLPDDVFKHVHCEIAADILVVRKRSSVVGDSLVQANRAGSLEEKLSALGGWEQSFADGTYFDQRPERILGKALAPDETGWRATVVGDANKVPGLLRDLTEKKLASKKGPESKTITADDLAKLAATDGDMKEYIQRAEESIRQSEIPPAIGNVKKMAQQRYIYVGEPPKWTLFETVDDVSQIIEKSGDAAIEGAHDIAKDIADLIKARDGGEYYRSRNLRRLAAERVTAWVKEHGIPGSHRALGKLSKSAPILLDFMACVDSNGELSDILSKDAAVTLKASEVDRSSLNSVADYVARRNNGYVTIEDIQHNWEGWEGKSEDEVRKAVLATGQYALDSSSRAGGGKSPLQHIEDYLTGNLYELLEAETERLAEVSGYEKAQIERQIGLIKERLETKRRSLDDIQIQLRVMGWMPPKYFSAYLNSPEGRDRVFHLKPRKPGDPEARIVYDRGIHTLQWVATEETTKQERVPSPSGYGHRYEQVPVKAGTVVAKTSVEYDFLKYMNRIPGASLRKEKAESVEQDIERGFSEWLKASEYRTEVEDLYNRAFNSEFRREYSGDPLGLEGLTDGIIPHDYQNQAVRWAAETGRGILGQDVGLGKTFIAILLARLRRQKGTSKRPMVVVPKSVATNWAEETEALFPGSRVLVIGEHRAKSRVRAKKAKAEGAALGLKGKKLTAYVEENSWTVKADTDLQRNQKLAMVKQNEYDLIICTKPAFDRIPLKEETIGQYEEDDFEYQRADKIGSIREKSKAKQTADRNIEKLKAAWAGDKLQERFKHEESVVFWEDLGIDTLMADEAHAYKNLYAAKSRFGQSPKFLGGSGQSKQARKMQHMSRFVRDANPSNGVYLLTATPTKNSPLEVYNMLQHIAPEAFRAMGIDSSEQFIDRFCQLEDRLVLTPPGKGEKSQKKGKEDRATDEMESQFAEEFEGSGNLEAAVCVTGFTNLKELETVMDKYMMLQTATDVGLKIPDANDHTHLVDMSPEQKSVYAELRTAAQKSNKDTDPGGMFRILDQMKKAAQDLELYDPDEYAGWYSQSPKYQACVDEAYKGARERGGQIVFCDHNKSHERLRAMLIEKGLKPEEIGIINAQVAKDSAARQAIGNRFNRGEIKVVIGNTGTMGEGVNLQGKKHEHGTTDIHHLDQPWDPGTMHQRNGRGVRQGNRADQVDVHTYLARGSFDGFRHSTLKGKERWLDKLRSGADSITNDMEGQDLDEAEMLAMLSDDPDAALRKIREKKADATSAWYVKQAQSAIDTYYNYQRRVARIAKVRGQTGAKQKMQIEAERLKRQLLRNELIPLEVKADLKAGNTEPAAVNTFMEGDRFAANLVRAGTVIEHDRGSKVVVESVNLTDRKIKVRSWGYAGSRNVDIDQIAGGGEFKVSALSAVDELKEALRENADKSWNTPLEAITHVSEAVLEANRDIIDEAVREWYAKHGESRKLLVRTEKGIEPEVSKDIGDKTIVYPWGKDRAELVEAVANANRGDRWNEWQNDLHRVGTREYGGSYHTPGPFTGIMRDAEEAWKGQVAA
jgi:SNF2 family DNA or RNA helicase/predicted RNA methylase